MRVSVLGATGFVGSSVVARLAQNGSGIETVPLPRSVDIADPNAVTDAIKGSDALVHAAGIASPNTPNEVCGWVDIAGTENVLAAAKQVGIKRVIYISCADVSLHKGPRPGWGEEQIPPGKPFCAWVEHKRVAESLVGVHEGAIALRPALLWGPNDRLNAPRWAAQSLAGGIELPGGGRNLISTTYIENLSTAVHAALMTPKEVSGRFHVLDAEMSVAHEFFTDIANAMGTNPPRRSPTGWWSKLMNVFGSSDGAHPVHVARENQSSSLDGRAARQLLRYEPNFTRAQGMAEFKRWVEENEGVSKIIALAKPPLNENDIEEQRSLAQALGAQ